ncbi:hypothetical protein HMPREF0972_01142 [Actinomyces sp. oral taxon 848 str. F0332]|nr:hypothetical protein HMPREF0972_01142 [Actinomyces sp. oral taxon 848 str. F0332]
MFRVRRAGGPIRVFCVTRSTLEQAARVFGVRPRQSACLASRRRFARSAWRHTTSPT